MKRHYFGTDGVRGPYGGPLINETFAARLGEAAGHWIGGTGSVLIGCDTRASGEALGRAVATGLAAAGVEAVSLGVVPTPAVALAVTRRNAALGVVITASHNPASDNGIKFFGPGGLKLSDADELAIEALLPDIAASPLVDPVEERGAGVDYIATMSAQLSAGALDGWRIVLDTANGATVRTSGAVLRNLGADIVALGATPDGHNINASVGSEHPGQMAEAVRRHGARLGIAHDGDGDRCILCDELGAVLDGDEILTILALHALAANRLAANTLVITVQSNLGVDRAVRDAGGCVVRTAVGDRHVIAGMLVAGSMLGGESSGHVICRDVAPTGDGLGAALQVLRVMAETGRPLSELRQVLRKFPQAVSALRVAEKRPLEECATLGAVVADLERELGDNGRLLVRYSGTEPKLRLLIEGPTEAVVTAGLARLEVAARTDLMEG